MVGAITLLGLFVVTGGATVAGSIPVFFHRYLKESHWTWWESFGGGVMTGASFFSLLLPAYDMIDGSTQATFNLLLAAFSGVVFILVSAHIVKRITMSALHQRAFLFVFVMGLHNVPEGLAVGADVAGIGWSESLPLTVAIFIQNLPEGFVSAMMFLLAGFSVKKSLIANGVTALIETVSSFFGFAFVSYSKASLPYMLAFAGACMLGVVFREARVKARGVEAANYSWSGFSVGVLITAVLDLTL